MGDAEGELVAYDEALASDVEAMLRMTGGEVATVELEGLSGRWILLAHPPEG